MFNQGLRKARRIHYQNDKENRGNKEKGLENFDVVNIYCKSVIFCVYDI